MGRQVGWCVDGCVWLVLIESGVKSVCVYVTVFSSRLIVSVFYVCLSSMCVCLCIYLACTMPLRMHVPLTCRAAISRVSHVKHQTPAPPWGGGCIVGGRQTQTSRCIGGGIEYAHVQVVGAILDGYIGAPVAAVECVSAGV